jgi:hypothetical protein
VQGVQKWRIPDFVSYVIGSHEPRRQRYLLQDGNEKPLRQQLAQQPIP